jgi:hypothetical protein
MLGQALPFMLNAFWEAHSFVAPSRLAAAAIDRYSMAEDHSEVERRQLGALLRDLMNTEPEISGTEEMSLFISREQLLALIGRYLSREFSREGGRDTVLEIHEHDSGLDGTFALVTRSVYVKLYYSSRDVNQANADYERAKSLNPSEFWIFYYDRALFGKDVQFDPVFVSENKILRGRFRMLNVVEIFPALTEGRLTATIGDFGRDDFKVKFLISKNPLMSRENQ